MRIKSSKIKKCNHIVYNKIVKVYQECQNIHWNQAPYAELNKLLDEIRKGDFK